MPGGRLWGVWVSSGPRHAVVESTAVRWSGATGDFTDFLIRG